MDLNLRKAEIIVKAYFAGYPFWKAVGKVKRNAIELDGDELYDTETGKTIGEIDTATDEQIREVLKTKKNPLQRIQK
ncbi:hypothetical protein KM799_08470 [Clostridium tyrobutyricum]|uniref:hypothetical protein n=1 Tax=Clostridium tyrobutyricum TaxID=1519 RepID=UPI001C37FC0F|nr:hypothetical protein [Clostridium tyrobutyricum]MBV4439271.1 hypothetical protein [Clostridium tyrobutyricum]MBV4446636.1 hypothetical protein [Clostridium tyrobutyricum]